jgi:hypothetical protein
VDRLSEEEEDEREHRFLGPWVVAPDGDPDASTSQPVT